MTLTLLNVLYVLIALAMVGFILVQRGAGAQAGSGFGAGASATVFGARGSASFLSRMTATLAALFFATSLTLAYLGGKKPEAPKSVIDRVGVPAAPVQDAPPAPTTQQAPTDEPVEAPSQPGDAQTSQPPQQ